MDEFRFTTVERESGFEGRAGGWEDAVVAVDAELVGAVCGLVVGMAADVVALPFIAVVVPRSALRS